MAVIVSFDRRLAWLPLFIAIASCKSGDRQKPQESGDKPRSEAPVAEGVPLPPSRPAAVHGQFRSAPWLAGAKRVAVGKLAGQTVVVAAAVRELRLHRVTGEVIAKAPASGTPQVLALMNIDGDPELEIVAGWGVGVPTRSATSELKIFDVTSLDEGALASVRSVELGPTTRGQIVDLEVDPDGHLLVAHFVSKYKVAISRIDPKQGGAMRMGLVRMLSAMELVELPSVGPKVLLGRIYGDGIGKPGGAFALEGKKQIPLPSLRGVRAAKWSAADSALIMADGWHREYAAKARALISRLSFSDGRWTRRVLAHVHGRHGYTALVVGDIDGDGAREVVAAGNGPAVAVSIDASGSEPAWELGGGEASDAAIADLDADGAPEVVIVGSEPGIWRSGPR